MRSAGLIAACVRAGGCLRGNVAVCARAWEGEVPNIHAPTRNTRRTTCMARTPQEEKKRNLAVRVRAVTSGSGQGQPVGGTADPESAPECQCRPTGPGAGVARDKAG